MKITENKKGRCTGCCAAALFAGLDGTYDFLLVAPVFLHPAEKDAKNHLTNCYGGVLYRKSRLHKKVIGACKKIVRLILMSNISRRKFLKGAGVAALAVAAAGVLTGCSNGDAPVIPEVTKEVKVIFICNGATAGKDGSVVVKKDAKTVLVSQIKAEQIPQGYTVESTGELKIQEIDGKECVLVTLKKIDTGKKVTVAFYDSVNKAMLSTTMTITVASDTEFVYKTDLKEALPGYEIIDNGKNQISKNNRVVMEVKPVNPAEQKEVTVYYYQQGMEQNDANCIGMATMNVDKTVTFLYANELPKVSKEVWMGNDKYLSKVVPVGNGPFRINYLGNNKGEVKVAANFKYIKA